MSANPIPSADPIPEALPQSQPKAWKTALFLVGSVALGGLAVALWNRRELAIMRNERDNPLTDGSPSSVQIDEEIF
jgi:hypothetical protein